MTREATTYEIDESITASDRYDTLKRHRQQFLDRARANSKSTIPYLMPSEKIEGAAFERNYQAVGASAVETLASKIALALMPPNEPFFRIFLSEEDKNLLSSGGDPEVEKSTEEELLASVEKAIMAEVESSGIRGAINTILRHLIVCGNVAALIQEDSKMRVYLLDEYVVRRDGEGRIIEMVIKETVSPVMISDEILDEIELKFESQKKKVESDDIDLFTYIVYGNGKYHIVQDLGDKRIKSSIKSYDRDNFPYLVLRYTKIDGESYGRGFVDLYADDLNSLKALFKAVVENAIMSARTVFTVPPGSRTRRDDVANAKNGDVIVGDMSEIGTISINRNADLTVAQHQIASIEDRLAKAFMVHSSVQRQAERVTAREITFLAEELQTNLGGIYSALSQELQVPIVRNMLDVVIKKRLVPNFPKNSLDIRVVTGIEALGRSYDFNNLSNFMHNAVLPLGDVGMQMINVPEFLNRIAVSMGIKATSMIKSPEEIEDENQKAMQQQQSQQGLSELEGDISNIEQTVEP